MSKRIKNMQIEDIKSQIGNCKEMLVVNSSQLDAITTNQWRLALQEKEISVLAVRNTLARRALNDVGVDALDEILEGPSTLIWGGEDIVALSKEITKWAKELGEKFEIKGGTVEGTPLDAAGIDALSKSPSREELIGQIVGLMLSPGANLAGAMLGPGGTLVGQIDKIGGSDEDE